MMIFSRSAMAMVALASTMMSYHTQALSLRGAHHHHHVNHNTATPTANTTTPTVASHSSREAPSPLSAPPQTFVDCLNAIKEGTVFPGDLGYDQARMTVNDRTVSKPAAIFYANSTLEVSSAIKCASSNNIKVSPASGRHSFTGMAMQDGFLIIDLTNMTKVDMDRESMSVKVGPGNSNAMMASALKNSGIPGAAVPLGTCTWVGVSGYILGGGMGVLGNHYGLACDSLQGLEMVTYDGDIVTANATHNSDLLWASCGGGGGTFGVVTELDMKLNIIPTKNGKVSLVQLFYKSGVENFVKTFQMMQNWLPKMESRFGVDGALYGDGRRGPGIILVGMYLGTPQEAAQALEEAGMLDPQLLEPFFAMTPLSSDVTDKYPAGVRIKEVDGLYDVWKESFQYWMGPQYGYNAWPWGPTFTGAPGQKEFLEQLFAGHAPSVPHQVVGGEYYGWWAYSQSRMTGLISEAAIRDIALGLERAKNRCLSSNSTDLATCGYTVYGHILGGAYHHKAPTDTAYYHRDKYFVLNAEVEIPRANLPQVQQSPQIVTDAKDVVDEYLRTLDSHLLQQQTGPLASYVNYQLPSEEDKSFSTVGDSGFSSTGRSTEETADWQVAYFGENYPRLQQIKAKWDPKNGFTKPMTVRASSTS